MKTFLKEKMKILLIGSKGQLGSELNISLRNHGEIIESDRSKLDLENLDKIPLYIEEINPAIIINASAYTNVEEAEDNEKLASKINYEAVSIFAKISKKLNILLIHFSTDYVFDGTKNDPYIEDDLPCPINIYGKTKLEGEKAIQESGCSYYIFRVSWLIGNYGNNFAKKIIYFAKNQENLKVIDDQMGVPTSPKLISEVMNHLIKSYEGNLRWEYGIYNLNPRGKASWFIIAKFIINFINEMDNKNSYLVKSVQPVSTNDFKTKAKRPINSLLDNSKLEKVLGYDLNNWESYFINDLKEILHNSF
tara:strand:+ start:100 stop:1017 length:918 start_codon:yes stop_codon:yes gene_type:complete